MKEVTPPAVGIKEVCPPYPSVFESSLSLIILSLPPPLSLSRSGGMWRHVMCGTFCAIALLQRARAVRLGSSLFPVLEVRLVYIRDLRVPSTSCSSSVFDTLPPLSLPPTRFFNQQPTSPSQLQLCCHSCCIASPARDETNVMAEYDIVPQDADDKQDALEEPGVAEPTDGEEDALEQPASDRKDRISSHEDERWGIDLPRRWINCRDDGCPWSCAHHGRHHNSTDGLPEFYRFPDLEHWDFPRLGYPDPELTTRFKSEMKDCQFRRIFFSIAQSDCVCGANARHDQCGGCRCKLADCRLRRMGSSR